MQRKLSQERAMVTSAIRELHLVRLYGWLAIPTFGPPIALIVLGYRRNQLRFEVITALACASVSLAGMVVLCYLGFDWGRWFHIQAVCLLLLVMLMDRKAAGRSAKAEPAKRHTPRFQAIATLALALYATLWTLPVFGTGGQVPGYLPLVWPTYRTTLHHLRLKVLGGVRQFTGMR